MTRTQLKKVAKRRGMIKWLKSGVYERVELREGVIVASGPVTPPHMLVGECFHCVEVDGKSLVSVGDAFFPRGPVPYSLVNETKRKFVAHEKERREARYQKRCLRVVKEVLNS